MSWKEGRDSLTGYDVRGRVLLAGRSADALTAEKPGPVRSVDENPGWSRSFSWPAGCCFTLKFCR